MKFSTLNNFWIANINENNLSHCISLMTASKKQLTNIFWVMLNYF